MTDKEHKRIKLLKRLACYCKYLAFCPDLFCQFNGYPGSAFDVALEPQCPGRKVTLKLETYFCLCGVFFSDWGAYKHHPLVGLGGGWDVCRCEGQETISQGQSLFGEIGARFPDFRQLNVALFVSNPVLMLIRDSTNGQKSLKWIRSYFSTHFFEEDRTLKAMLRVVDTLAQDPEYKFSAWAAPKWSKGSRFKTCPN